MNEPQTLRDLVQHAQSARGGSGRSLAAAAERAGHKITHTTVNQLAAGTYRFKPSAETIRAVAWLAGVTEEVAFAAAGVPMPGPPFSEELPPGVDNLSPRSRRAAVEVLRALVEAEQGVGGHGGDTPAKYRAGGSPADETADAPPPQMGDDPLWTEYRATHAAEGVGDDELWTEYNATRKRSGARSEGDE